MQLGQRHEVLLDALDQARRYGNEQPVLEAAVLEAARVQRERAVGEDRVHLGRHEVALAQHRAHGKLVLARAPPLRAAGEVRCAQQQHGVLAPADVDTPALRADLAHAPDDDVADLADVARVRRAHRYEPVNALHRAGDVGQQLAALKERPVPAQPAGAAAGRECVAGDDNVNARGGIHLREPGPCDVNSSTSVRASKARLRR